MTPLSDLTGAVLAVEVDQDRTRLRLSSARRHRGCPVGRPKTYGRSSIGAAERGCPIGNYEQLKPPLPNVKLRLLAFGSRSYAYLRNGHLHDTDPGGMIGEGRSAAA